MKSRLDPQLLSVKYMEIIVFHNAAHIVAVSHCSDIEKFTGNNFILFFFMDLSTLCRI